MTIEVTGCHDCQLMKNRETVNRMKRVVKGLHWWWNIYLITPQYERCRWFIPKDERLPF